jgi:EAL domain-containing protein (putative c-di-GMP-specific phosphodiesterase class I)
MDSITERCINRTLPIDAERAHTEAALQALERALADDMRQIQDLKRTIEDRTRDIQSLTAQLNAARQQLSVAGHIEKTQMTTQVRRRVALEESLRHALDANELTVHYQPLIDITTRRLVSLEALVRWQHPTQGLVSPGIFIPAAEESGLILPIGEFVLNTVCRQVVSWQQANVPVVPVAVNVSAVQLQHQDLCATVRGVLKATGMSPRLLSLELTESTLMKDTEHYSEELQCLRKDGIRIQIDDFGTGYSSLSYLTHLPIDTLKIDRSFVSRINASAPDEAIVSAILAMARSLRLRVVAEGVETAEQLAMLERHGCEIAQGFYFSRPLPADEIRKLFLELADRPSFTETVRFRLTERASFGEVAHA